MKTSNLISKLNKMNVSHTIIDVNGYNKDIQFTINGIVFKAGIEGEKENITDLCREITYDNVNQEMQRRFFESFNKLVKYANR